jgi:hypothetical protein
MPPKILILILCLLIQSCGKKPSVSCSELLGRSDLQHFELRGKGLVFDTKNQIEWYQCSVGQRYSNNKCTGEAMILTWTDSVAAISEINEKSRTSWRLPSLGELSSLRVDGCSNPSINPNIFPGILVENYWAKDESPHPGFRCGMYTFSGATSCRLFYDLERPFLMVRDVK